MSAGRSLWIWHLETGAQRLSGAPSVTLGSPQVGQQQVAASVLAERRQNAPVNTPAPMRPSPRSGRPFGRRWPSV